MVSVDGRVAPGGSPATSTTNRLATRALACARACTCTGRPEVHVLRGFDLHSRSRARAVRDRIREAEGIAALDAPIAILALEPADAPDRHACVYVDVSDQSGESARFAALRQTPLVAPGADPTEPITTDDSGAVPVMRAVFGDDSHVPSPRVFPLWSAGSPTWPSRPSW